MNGFLDVAGITLLAAFAGIGYFLPALIAITKEHPNKGWIVICNFFFIPNGSGWGFGWWLCLFWALFYNTEENEGRLRKRGL